MGMKKAKFVFWWEIEPGEWYPFFNVIANDRGFNNGSTVDGDDLLKKYGIPLPLFPSLETWKRETEEKRRCFRCWATVRGRADEVHHRALVHLEKLIGAAVLLVAVIFSAVRPSFAWEFKRNPDRFPSIGFTATNLDLSGTRDNVDEVNATLTRDQSGPDKLSLNSVGLDLRLPVSDQLTFTISAASVSQDTKFVRGGTYTDKQSISGQRYEFGARLYFSK